MAKKRDCEHAKAVEDTTSKIEKMKSDLRKRLETADGQERIEIEALLKKMKEREQNE